MSLPGCAIVIFTVHCSVVPFQQNSMVLRKGNVRDKRVIGFPLGIYFNQLCFFHNMKPSYAGQNLMCLLSTVHRWHQRSATPSSVRCTRSRSTLHSNHYESPSQHSLVLHQLNLADPGPILKQLFLQTSHSNAKHLLRRGH